MSSKPNQTWKEIKHSQKKRNNESMVNWCTGLVTSLDLDK